MAPGPGELWTADRHVRAGAVLQGRRGAGAAFIVREHGRYPRLAGQGKWHGCGRTSTGQAREQAVRIKDQSGTAVPWRRVELALDQPAEDGDAAIRLWSNLPGETGAGRVAELYRTRWRIEGMFGRLERVRNSEAASLGHPRAALPCFAAPVLAYNVLALLARCVERAHCQQEPPPEVSAFHLAQHVRGSDQGLLIAVPSEGWLAWHDADPVQLAERLLRVAQRINPRAVATSRRGAKTKTPKAYANGKTARAHVATDRVLAQPRTRP